MQYPLDIQHSCQKARIPNKDVAFLEKDDSSSKEGSSSDRLRSSFDTIQCHCQEAVFLQDIYFLIRCSISISVLKKFSPAFFLSNGTRLLKGRLYPLDLIHPASSCFTVLQCFSFPLIMIFALPISISKLSILT